MTDGISDAIPGTFAVVWIRRHGALTRSGNLYI